MRRRLLVAVFLLFGAVVNVAVAWGCGYFHHTGGHRVRYLRGISVNSQFDAVTQKYQLARATPTARYMRVGRDYISATGWDPPLSTMQSLQQMNHVQICFAVYRAGLPLRSLTGHTMMSTKWVAGKRPENRPWTHAGMLTWGQGNGHTRRLLLRPIWPGFVVNTLFYAAVLWLLICGPFVLRRFIRMKRGRCVKCGYPLGDSDVCTECGKPLPGRATVAT